MADIIVKGGFEEARCKLACPAGIDVPRYIRAIRLGKYEDALKIIREKIPFPSVCGYVCPRFCEMKCRRAEVDEPIAIDALKRFVADKIPFKIDSKVAKSVGKKVAIVGSGPAGLTAAYYLTRTCNHQVTIFESRMNIGGMPEGGIPLYRLPREVLNEELNQVKNVGMEIKTGIKVDKPESLLQQGFAAVFVAVGAWKSGKLGIPGEENPGVLDGLEFLNDAKSGKSIKLGNNVAVIGGGNVAVDAARTALRLGAKKVSIIYRRGREEMPARHDEIEQALDEGVNITVLTNPTKIALRGKKIQVNLVRMRLGGIDESRRRRQEEIPGSKVILSFDTLIVAIGESPSLEGDTKLARRRNGTIVVDPVTLKTNIPGVFAGGDAVSGPATVIEAIAAGRKAAQSMDVYLGGKGDIDEIFAPTEEIKAESWEESILEIPRQRMPVQDSLQRTDNFNAVELGLTEEMARNEAERCLRCDLKIPVTVDTKNCVQCYVCQQVCSFTYQHAYNPEKARIIIEHWPKKIHYKGDCIGGCSLCVRYCTTEGISFGAKTVSMEEKA
jgi:NADPH-dependent glutamate synthase beta subunit-like oxidoreductase